MEISLALNAVAWWMGGGGCFGSQLCRHYTKSEMGRGTIG